jgi:4'-phosphopantetheinyl transferase
MSVDSQEKTKKCNGEWKFALLELADSHYAAICIEDDQASGGAVTVDIGPMRVIVHLVVSSSQLCPSCRSSYEGNCSENHPVC